MSIGMGTTSTRTLVGSVKEIFGHAAVADFQTNIHLMSVGRFESFYFLVIFSSVCLCHRRLVVFLDYCYDTFIMVMVCEVNF